MGTFPRHQPAKNLKAVSLIEVLVTLSLLSLAMGLIASLASQYLRLASEGTRRSQGSQVVQALQAIVNELASAVEVARPALGETTEDLVFRKLDPSLERFPVPAPDPFLAIDPSTLLQIHYALDGTSLTRQLRGASRLPLIDPIEGLSARRPDANQVELSLTYRKGDKIETLRSRVYLWGVK